MGRPRLSHRLSNVDPVTRHGDCQECGYVKVYKYTHGDSWTCSELVKAYGRQNRGRQRETAKRRYYADPDYRAKRIRAATAHNWGIKAEDREAFERMYDEDCFYCGNLGGTVDHLVAQAVGGTDDLSNLVPACKTCNSRKRALSVEEFYRQFG